MAVSPLIVTVASSDMRPEYPSVLYCAHMEPESEELEESIVKECVSVWPLKSVLAVEDGYPEHEDGEGEPFGTKQKTVLVHMEPVDCPSVAVNVVPCTIGTLQRKPGLAMHVVPISAPELKTPRENRAARTIATISIAQPYVIKYSMALCAFRWAMLYISPVRFVQVLIN